MPGGDIHKTFKIFCGNLAGQATKDDLYYLFSKFGPVIEAVVMVGKYYGFVHMAYEEDGWKAICDLRGYVLHGKAMAVEASINAKKPTPLYKQNIIGKGITTLDDFNDYGPAKLSKATIPTKQRHRAIHEDVKDVGQADAKLKTKINEGRERQGPPPPLPQLQPFLTGDSSNYIIPCTAPPTIYSFPPPFTVPPQMSPLGVPPQPSPLGHTPPPPLSRASPMSDYQPLKAFDPMKGSESPMLNKMPPVDANSNPIHEPERQENMPALCSTCGSIYDEWQHKPKILSCGHTFCCECLLSRTCDNEVTCPVGCHYTTVLTGVGIPGLTTNYTVPIKTFAGSSISPPHSGIPSGFGLQNGAQRASSTPPSVIVCCTCLKIGAEEFCASQGHQLIPEGHARDFLRAHLQTAQEVTLKQLRQTMTMRAAMKERLERTLQSVEKFLEELRRKVEGEVVEEAVLQEQLAELTVASEALADGAPITQLIDSINKVQYYNSLISMQFNQSAAISAINNATEAIVIKLKQSALDSALASMGFHTEESFSMASSLEEHAMYGNNANVLLLYMLSDLLSTRMTQLTVTPISPLSPTQQPTLTAPSVLQPPMSAPSVHQPSHLPPTPVSAGMMEDNINRALGLAPPKVNDLNNHDIGKLNELKSQEMNSINVEHILQMTEAIEAGSLLNANDSIAVASVTGSNSVSSALSLGLANLSLLGSEPIENGKDDLESLLDKKEQNPVSYVDAAKKPAKPTPPPPDTPPKIPVAKANSPAIRPGKFPHCWMVLSIDGIITGRIIFELRPDKAPRMCDNFIALCTGRNGYGYKGTHFFKSGEGFLAGGDVENDDGTGGYSAFDKSTFEADLCPLKDEVGMVRFKGIGTSDKGRGMIGSQFMIWCGDRDFKKFSYSLVFGKVVDGLDVAKKAAEINVHRVSVKVEECGAI